MVAIITKDMLLQKIQAFLDELADQPLTQGGLEWYLINNLKIYADSIERSVSTKEIETASRVLSRFCTESMDWGTPLYRRCSELAEAGFRLAKS